MDTGQVFSFPDATATFATDGPAAGHAAAR
jgi:hypothetical protein